MGRTTMAGATPSEASTTEATMTGSELHTLTLSRVFAAPRERVYRAFSDGDNVARGCLIDWLLASPLTLE